MTIHDDTTATIQRDRRGRYRMVVGFTVTYVISAYHHQSCEFESRSCQGVLTCDRSIVSPTNKTDRHDITEILLKVTLNTSTL